MKMILRTSLLALLPALLLALAACATQQDGPAGAGDAADAASPIGSWSLTKIEDERYDLPSSARTPTLVISERGGLSGQAGVNRFTGKADSDALGGGNWEPGGIAMTRMGGEADAMRFEQRYVAFIQRADTIAVGPQWLELRIGNRPLLRFARAGR